MSTVRRAVEVACEWHGAQRYGKHPYIVHLIDVARHSRGFGVQAETVAYLHDILEDTKMPPAQLGAIFGPRVREAVEVLTDPPGATRKERKAAAYAKLGEINESSPLAVALIVKAADRLANVEACVADGNERLLDMYRKEHPAFLKAVQRPFFGNHILLSATSHLLSPTGSTST